MEEYLGANLLEVLTKLGASNNSAHIIRMIIIFTGIGFLSILSNYITKKIIIKYLGILIKKSKTEYDDVYYEKNVFTLLSHIVPALFIYFLVPLAFLKGGKYPFDTANAIEFIQSMTYIYMIIVVLLVINSFLSASNIVYDKIAEKKGIQVSIKGYLQVFKILFIIIGIIVIASVLFDKEPGAIFAGMGAMAAILLLIFKDTILGFVAGIQLSAYKMMKVGDWISMPSRKADGTVIDISLSTVKIQNFNKTITLVPTYALVTESFTNWQGMSESGGRRIKRTVNIDVNTIKFVDEKLLEKFKNIDILKNYILEKEKDLKEYNAENNVTNLKQINGRKLTNIGTFRKYIELYLRENLAEIEEKETFIDGNLSIERKTLKEGKFLGNQTILVNLLQVTEMGVPIQIYVFASTTAWVAYEKIQSDLMDHLLAILPEFELKAFQNPTGLDFRKM